MRGAKAEMTVREEQVPPGNVVLEQHIRGFGR